MACLITNLMRVQCVSCGAGQDVNLAFSDANYAIAVFLARHQLCEEKANDVDSGEEGGSGSATESVAGSEEETENAS